MPEIGLGLVLWPMRNVEAIMVLNISCPLFPTCFQVTIFYIVPDGGSPGGAEIEIAEKAQLLAEIYCSWRPVPCIQSLLGRNAFVASSRLVALLEEGLRATFHKEPDFHSASFHIRAYQASREC